ncbi:MAG: ABC transporter permease [Rhodospirillaceae bacterium]|nr:ABC transporter permease [Rhodospirillaceae bacterium]OUU20162.1 MAG: ABC transporter permease [Candidatus Endolissoclinum sp. TMED37]
MRNIFVITSRELFSYFGSSLGYILAAIFVAISAGLTFYFGHFFDRGVADLNAFFQYHPWLHLLLMPALGMRLWAEEIKLGTFEFLICLPVKIIEVVVGKFLAAWIYSGVVLLLTFPLWITVNLTGNPDNGVIFATYGASWLMAGGFLTLSACASAMTSNQAVAFVIAVTMCFLSMMTGVELIQGSFHGWAPEWLTETASQLSMMSNFNEISKGVIDFRNFLYFFSLITMGLLINSLIIAIKKA